MSIATVINSARAGLGVVESLPIAPVLVGPVPMPPKIAGRPGRPPKSAVSGPPPTPNKSFYVRRVAVSKAKARKRSDPLARRTKRFMLYLTPVAEAALRKAAWRKDVTMSAFVLDAVRVAITCACPRTEWPEDQYW